MRFSSSRRDRGTQRNSSKLVRDIIFFGAGGRMNRNGIAVLLHKWWTQGLIAFRACSDRLRGLDSAIGLCKYRFASVHMPTTKHPNTKFDAIEEALSSTWDDAIRNIYVLLPEEIGMLLLSSRLTGSISNKRESISSAAEMRKESI